MTGRSSGHLGVVERKCRQQYVTSSLFDLRALKPEAKRQVELLKLTVQTETLTGSFLTFMEPSPHSSCRMPSISCAKRRWLRFALNAGKLRRRARSSHLGIQHCSVGELNAVR